MSWKRHVCPFVVPGPLRPPTDHIWISDDILDPALHRFMRCRVQVRHGSCIPGPLEARKRATKRRLMNLAQAGGGGAIDSASLAGLKGLEQQGFQWQAPDPPASRTTLTEKKDGKRLLLLSATIKG